MGAQILEIPLDELCSCPVGLDLDWLIGLTLSVAVATKIGTCLPWYLWRQTLRVPGVYLFPLGHAVNCSVFGDVKLWTLKKNNKTPSFLLQWTYQVYDDLDARNIHEGGGGGGVLADSRTCINFQDVKNWWFLVHGRPVTTSLITHVQKNARNPQRVELVGKFTVGLVIYGVRLFNNCSLPANNPSGLTEARQ